MSGLLHDIMEMLLPSILKLKDDDAAYDKLRGGMGGIAIARMIGGQCGGCHLGLSAMEVARLRKLPDGEIAHCEECGRILVP